MRDGFYLTTAEWGAANGVKASRVRQLCEAGHISGAFKHGPAWAIPVTGIRTDTAPRYVCSGCGAPWRLNRKRCKQCGAGMYTDP